MNQSNRLEPSNQKAQDQDILSINYLARNLEHPSVGSDDRLSDPITQLFVIARW